MGFVAWHDLLSQFLPHSRTEEKKRGMPCTSVKCYRRAYWIHTIRMYHNFSFRNTQSTYRRLSHASRQLAKLEDVSTYLDHDRVHQRHNIFPDSVRIHFLTLAEHACWQPWKNLVGDDRASILFILAVSCHVGQAVMKHIIVHHEIFSRSAIVVTRNVLRGLATSTNLLERSWFPRHSFLKFVGLHFEGYWGYCRDLAER